MCVEYNRCVLVLCGKQDFGVLSCQWLFIFCLLVFILLRLTVMCIYSLRTISPRGQYIIYPIYLSIHPSMVNRSTEYHYTTWTFRLYRADQISVRQKCIPTNTIGFIHFSQDPYKCYQLGSMGTCSGRMAHRKQWIISIPSHLQAVQMLQPYMVDYQTRPKVFTHHYLQTAFMCEFEFKVQLTKVTYS